jgi:DNA invertase Pin-like site-specific DNA recombinase
VVHLFNAIADQKLVQINTLDGSIDTTNNSPFATAQLSLIGVFAQLERDLIVQRTGEGRKIAIAKGVKFGRKSALDESKQKDVKLRTIKGDTIYSIAKDLKVSRLKWHS